MDRGILLLMMDRTSGSLIAQRGTHLDDLVLRLGPDIDSAEFRGQGSMGVNGFNRGHSEVEPDDVINTSYICVYIYIYIYLFPANQIYKI